MTIVDLNLATDAIAVVGPNRDTAATPGSTLKPFVLLTAMRVGVITPHTRIACSGSLRVAGSNLACAHPASFGILDSEEAIAYSCNTYLARVAEELPSSALERGLQDFGIHSTGGATKPEERVLLGLGLQRVTITPLQLARAYAQLGRTLQQPSPQHDTIRAGLLGSVEYGMAHAAQTSPIKLGGKTGTAHDPAPMLQHGWFAGIVFASSPERRPTHVVVVYAPGGNGNDASLAAHNYLQSRHWQ